MFPFDSPLCVTVYREFSHKAEKKQIELKARDALQIIEKGATGPMATLYLPHNPSNKMGSFKRQHY